MVDELLNEAAMTLSEVDVIAFTAGPGSFTGIRIGFGVVQGLAFGADLPVLPVSSLETLAYTAIRKLQLPPNTHIIPMFDARMSEIYWAQFYYNSGHVKRTHDDSLCAPENLDKELLDSDLAGPVTIVGDGWNYSEKIALAPNRTEIALLPEAQDILTIARPLIEAGKTMSIERAAPIYLRDKITWKKRERLRQV
jgi:tRNA threonylcarbamoyladenosine biosynthesis protein TsaB